MISKKNILIIGAGYVGFSLSICLSNKNNVTLIDTNKEKVKKIKLKTFNLNDNLIKHYIKNKKYKIQASYNLSNHIEENDIFILALPTNFIERKKSFDTSLIEKTIKKIRLIKKNSLIVIKSTTNIGFTEKLQKKFKTTNIIYAPEFIREGNALYDNLYPSRIIIGGTSKKAKDFGNLLLKSTLKKDVPLYFMNSKEAETVKLFSNSYLAIRVAFFNEVDNFAIGKNLDANNIITGICSDERIGDFYNNPSFGYGGYCLPKDSKQALSDFNGIPQALFKSIISSNSARKKFILDEILKTKPKVVGVYRLIMKSKADNFRSSSVIDLIKGLKKNKIKVIIFEPNISDDIYLDCLVENNLSVFSKNSTLIIANRLDKKIVKFKKKLYSRDLFSRD